MPPVLFLSVISSQVAENIHMIHGAHLILSFALFALFFLAFSLCWMLLLLTSLSEL